MLRCSPENGTRSFALSAALRPLSYLSRHQLTRRQQIEENITSLQFSAHSSAHWRENPPSITGAFTAGQRAPILPAYWFLPAPALVSAGAPLGRWVPASVKSFGFHELQSPTGIAIKTTHHDRDQRFFSLLCKTTSEGRGSAMCLAK